MKFVLPAVLALSTAAFTSPAAQSRNVVPLEAADCARLNMMFGDYEVGRASQHATVPLSAGTLNVQPPGNGGVQIEKGAGREYSITACIAAGAANRGDAQRLADAVRLRIDGNRVGIENAGAARSWSVQIVVEVPDGGSVDAETTNGPISVSGVSGRFNVRASNGPIALDDVSGQVMARAANGPISVSGSRGDIDAVTQNGPISVQLKGSRWEGKLDARANSGPLQVSVPADYRSGVEISSRGSSPWECRASACRNGARDWEQGSRTLRVGPDPVVVKIATVNGPVTVDDARRR
jgi:DUF4097 and DUF4098 domain-containing protein YvlB